MIEFIQTLGKGIVQGFRQYIDNDLSSYVPLYYCGSIDHSRKDKELDPEPPLDDVFILVVITAIIII